MIPVVLFQHQTRDSPLQRRGDQHGFHLSVGTVELHTTAEFWDLGNTERYQNVQGKQVLWEQTGWILEAQN